MTESNDSVTDNDKKKPRNPWTETFIQVAEYLVRDYGDKVKVESEFPLFKNPMRIDAVIIKREEGLVIDNAVMRFFKKHNIVEFKSPKDRFNIEAFDKTISYYFAYLSNERKSETPPLTPHNVTLTIISVRKPIKSLKILREERGFKIIETEISGIYYIIKEGFVPDKIQLVISSELPSGNGADDQSLFADDQSLLWLRSLRDNLTAEEVVELVEVAEEKYGGESIRNIVYFLLDANPQIEKEVEEMQATMSPRTMRWIGRFAEKQGLVDEMAREKTKNIAKKLLARGDSVDDVVAVTELDLNDVLKLKGEM